MKVLVLIPVCLIAITFYGCSGCSKSGRIKSLNSDISTERGSGRDNQNVTRSHGGKVVVKMIKENGVYKIKAKINGQELEFIFDTGAGMISLSNVEATLLYKEGKIKKEDIVGKENFQDATGNISEGVVINLKEVTIGDRTVYNIEASVTNNNNAPVLFGQTALEKFGKITIDYENGELTFQ